MHFMFPQETERLAWLMLETLLQLHLKCVPVVTTTSEKAYNITGGEALSYYQVAEILSREVGKKISYINISDEDARKGMKDAGADEWTINSMIELFGIIRVGYAAAVSPTVEQITGNRPIRFSQFAKDNASHFKAQLAKRNVGCYV